MASALHGARRLAAVALMLAAAAAPGATAEPVLTARQALRMLDDGSTAPVTLTDRAELAAGEAPPLRRRYRLEFDFDAPPPGYALYFPGLAAHARISVNGQALADTLDRARERQPMGIDRIVLLRVPDAFWRPGANRIEIEAAAPRALSVSPLVVGPASQLAGLQRARQVGTTFGPAAVALVMGALGLFVLLLGTRRRDSVYRYFGAGTFAWALHNAWFVSPAPLTHEPHETVWWTALMNFFVAMMMIFCLRFADWRWPRFERAAWAAVGACPLVLYAAAASGALDSADELWRLGLLGGIGVALAAVVDAAWRRPSVDATLVAGAGAMALLFGAHDWLVAYQQRANETLFLVPYAGLFFVVFVVRMLVERFVDMARALELANLELEQRVAQRSRELEAALEQMRAARNAAESADQAKTRFLAAASHDLRQPVHALGLYVAALRAEALAPGAADLAQRVANTLGALDQMFDTLLDISRIDAGAVVPQRHRFEIGTLLRALADEFAPQCEVRGLRLALRLPDRAAPPETLGDAALVERILRNLLANAIKYTAEGGVLLACRRRGADWSVEVWDSGIGIAAADRERVFDEFVQLGNPGRQRAQGLGLGLAIVRRLCALLGLTLALDSRPGHGSRFALRLPAAAPARTTALRPAEPAPAPQLDGLRVALIEDDADVRDAMGLLLARWGCGVVAGADAAQVLASSAGAAPARALIADYRLGGARTGLQEAATLRRHWGTLPVLIVTGDASAPMLRELGAAGYRCLNKPVPPESLRKWLLAVSARPPQPR